MHSSIRGDRTDPWRIYASAHTHAFAFAYILIHSWKLISWEVDLVGVDLVGVDLVGVDRVGVDLVGVDLVGVDRVGVDLVGGHQYITYNAYPRQGCTKRQCFRGASFG